MRRPLCVAWDHRSRQNLLIVVGAYHNSKQELGRLSNSPALAKAKIDLMAPLTTQPSGQRDAIYSNDYVRFVLAKTWSYIYDNRREATESPGDRTVSAWPLDKADIILKYNFVIVLYRKTTDASNLLEDLAPIFYSMPFDVDLTPRQIRDAVVEIGRHVEQYRGVLAKILQPNAHRSCPLMLPVVNFVSGRRDRLFRKIATGIGQNESFVRLVQQARSELRPKGAKTFVDERSVAFDPADEEHGANRVRKANVAELKCTLGGCYRFSIPYPCRFHYDVSHQGRSGVCFYDPLGEIKMLAAGQWLNVAPNDRLRG